MSSTRCGLFELAVRHAPGPGVFSTPIDGFILRNSHVPETYSPFRYRPMLGVLFSGCLAIHSAKKQSCFGLKEYFCYTDDAPITFRIANACPRAPVLGAYFFLDSKVVAEFINHFQYSSNTPDTMESPGLCSTPRSHAFDQALLRLLELLGDPCAAKVLWRARLQELLFVVLRGPLGPSLRMWKGVSHQLSEVLRYLRAHFHQSPPIEELARKAGMSRPVFDRNFKSATSYSPLQYIKTLRLNEATYLLEKGVPVGEAASRVGYNSQSQFSRDFRKKFGVSARDWVQRSEVEPRNFGSGLAGLAGLGSGSARSFFDLRSER